MFKNFKEFAMKGNVMDLAVGVIIGAAFGKIIQSFVADILMPPLGLLLGKMDFSNLFVSLSGDDYATIAAAKEAGAPTLNYGLFINQVVDFLIVAFAIFLLVNFLGKMKKTPVVDPTTKECPHCLSVISIKATKCAHCTSVL